MTEYGIALDIGTSGLRAQAIDLGTGETVGTAITQRHPIPGMNVIDHVNFAIKSGEDVANRLLVDCANQLFASLGIDLSKVKRIGVCGNTFQMSLFQNIEIRDLAYAGQNMLKDLGVVPPKRDGAVINARSMGIKGVAEDTVVIIPPAVRHEIGADAIAMLLITGVADAKEPTLVVDYGTNAEMALICGDGRIITGSAAAGPAMEGQEIERGMLAAPGAISDVDIVEDGWKCTVLDSSMIDREGDTVDPMDGRTVRKGEEEAIGITGTGTVAALYDGIKSGIIPTCPNINTPDGKLHLMNGINITSHDVDEAGKAIGAMRAGFLTLLHEAGMWTGDVKTAYMSGASGLYVDAVKALGLGMVVPGATHLIQFGNTSIEMARRIAMGTIDMEFLKQFAQKLKATHCMFATSETFKQIYSIEYSVWCTGMPMSMYDEMLGIYNLPPLGKPSENVSVERKCMTDLPDTDKCPVKVIESGTFLTARIDGCIYCRKCMKECPEKALTIVKGPSGCSFRVDSARCGGTACRRCERACPQKVLHLDGGKPTA
ncbi:MAG: methylamine methyltransferase corrinoid protein reductive activase [Candidatus Methanomethylophilus sp.]|nr:methylamine methyltransferase corrinoid protein reductive activase [Methanomethylophilus sp.]MCI2093456.1 methylamine methyltransferase corrinoid protein reductive activase [Methanomethylophilus sp.]MEE3400867.1 methylamine methyltransferase corrinoid protein reductive activase [Methanomethylophilus sp.]WII09181.1 methylamine methyltransferase corrinoid protein reductive activase [Methanomassiliicoccales archaeon LGM-DZ1]